MAKNEFLLNKAAFWGNLQALQLESFDFLFGACCLILYNEYSHKNHMTNSSYS
jgi:hypothetical protein